MKHPETSPDTSQPPRTAKLAAASAQIKRMFEKVMVATLNGETNNHWAGVIDGPSATVQPPSQLANSAPHVQPPEAHIVPPEPNQV